MDDNNDNMMLFCSICFEAYDENNKAPRILPGCYHSVCSFCLKQLYGTNKHFLCPECRIKISEPIEKIQKNRYILGIMEMNKKKEDKESKSEKISKPLESLPANSQQTDFNRRSLSIGHNPQQQQPLTRHSQSLKYSSQSIDSQNTPKQPKNFSRSQKKYPAPPPPITVSLPTPQPTSEPTQRQQKPKYPAPAPPSIQQSTVSLQPYQQYVVQPSQPVYSGPKYPAPLPPRHIQAPLSHPEPQSPYSMFWPSRPKYPAPPPPPSQYSVTQYPGSQFSRPIYPEPSPQSTTTSQFLSS